MQRCLLTGEYLPSVTVIAAHLYKHEWRDLAEADIGLLDIDDPGNGLLLWQLVEQAFDTSALSFIYEKSTDRYVLLGSLDIGYIYVCTSVPFCQSLDP